MAFPTYIPLTYSEPSGYMLIMKYAPQAETPQKVNRPFSQADWWFVLVVVCAVPLVGRLPTTVSPVVSGLGGPETQSFLATGVLYLRGIHSVGRAHLQAWAGPQEQHRGRALSHLALVGQGGAWQGCLVTAA